MLKIKKIIATVLSCCILSTSICSIHVLAAENTISSETKITNDNLKDVLEYVGLDKDDFIADTSVSNGVTTVKDLEAAIAKVKQSTVLRATTQRCTDYSSMFRASSGTKSMTQTFDNDAYTFDVTVSASYSGKSWTGVNGVSASVDSGQLVITYKIDSQDMSATYVFKSSGSRKLQ